MLLFESIVDIAHELGLPDNWNRQQFDPALMTFDEYAKIANEQGKFHPELAYDFDVKTLNQYERKINFPKLIRQIRSHGINFEIRMQFTKERFVKIDPETSDVVRINGETQYYADDEVIANGGHVYQWSIGVFDGQTMVAAVQDEWGCVLVVVAQEYRGMGLGPILVKLARSIQPTKTSGGFTPGGYHNFRKVYREFVQDALSSGYYRALVQQGTLTIDRVKQIVASAKAQPVSKPSRDINYADNPKDYVLFVDDYGDFVIYSKLLAKLLKEEDNYFTQRMMKGMVYVQIHDRHEHAMLRVFGGASVKIKKLLMTCAIEYARRHQVVLYLEPGELQFVDPTMATVDPTFTVEAGFRAQKVTPTGKAFDFDPMSRYETAWRKTFDRHDEFRTEMLEMAYAEFTN